MKEKGGRGKMVTAVKPIRPTHVEFETERDMNKFIEEALNPKKHKDDPNNSMREKMRKHREQRTKK